MRKLSFLLVLLLLTAMQVLAQRTITGKVTSADDGSGIPGVTVLIKGTSTGVLTDLDGKYSISVPKDANALQFSFVGMQKQEVALTASNVVDVILQSEAQKIEGVVITALGISRDKKSLGYSVQDVQGSDLTKAREANVVNALTGKVAGVQITNSSGSVGATSRIVLRGVTSLSGDNQPLFVVDGVPISNSTFGNSDGYGGTNRGSGIADVNPDDIESVSVLKGPNAAALYGSRASNGVIIITTKKGKSQKGKGIGVAYSNTTMFDTPLRLPDYQDGYGQGSSGLFSYVDGANGGVNDGVDESWGPKLDVGTLIPQWDSPIVGGVRQATPWISHPDNIKDFFDVGTAMTNNIALDGGNENANFRISYTNFNQKGMVPNTDLKRNTFALSAGGHPSKNLTVEGNANYINSRSDNMSNYGYDAQNVMQQFIWSGRQNNIPDLAQYTFTDGTKRNWNYNYHNNPYFTLYENTNKMNRDRLYGNTKATYKFTDYLSAKIGVAIDNWTNWNSSRIAWTDIDNPFGFYDENKQTFRETNEDVLIMFNKKLTEDINLSLNAGGNMMQQTYQSNEVQAPQLAVAGVYNVSNSKVAQKAYNYFSEKRINSLYFNGQVSFKALYLDFTGRNDWSSTLPTTSNSYFYPSVSLSGVVSDMLSTKPTWLSLAKARVSWAKVGSDTGPYNLNPVLAFGEGWNASTKLLNQAVPNALPNGDLTPQFTNSLELGLNLAFFQNRINFDFTYYDGKTIDQIIPIPISYASGYTSKYINAGQVDNSGIEISLGLVPIKSASGFEWDMDLNFSKNTNTVVSLAPGIEQYQLGTYWSLQVLAIPGQPMGSLYGYDFARDPEGNIINENGVPLQGDLKVLGNSTPDWIGGMNNTFRYKGMEFSFLLDFHKGGDIYSMTNSWGRYAGVLEETMIGREGGVVGPGVKLADDGVTYVPNDVVVTAEEYNHTAYSNTMNYSSVFDASYLKLREMKLGYTFSQLGPFNNLSISVIGRNLALLYSVVPHIDPETSFSNSNGVQGLEFGQLPSARSIGFSLGLKF
ncbi:MAG: SusC/RagA family TonB-linked outer membrane protein [Bacteroidales bacterium]|nr:SusC/RagA family TonB-linked outer membrane protein [Bacteroidales bacterium]